jgi:hypothetical protein
MLEATFNSRVLAVVSKNETFSQLKNKHAPVQNETFRE